MGTLKRSWIIFQKSWTVIDKNRKLLVFPLISMLAITFLLLLIASGTLSLLPGNPLDQVLIFQDKNPDGTLSAGKLASWFIVYLLVMLTANLCQMAFYNEIFRGLRGKKVYLMHGFQCAAKRFIAALLWTLLSSTVGVILRLLQPRVGGLGLFLVRGSALIWVVASCFAIPVIVFDPRLNNPLRILKRSEETIRNTWGEALIGFAGLHTMTWLAFFIWLAVSAGLGSLALAMPGLQMETVWTCTVLFGIFLFFAYLVSAAEKVYLASLYIYARGGGSDLFNKKDLENAFIQPEV
ncbi:MAG: hypothetical protein IKB16_12825 [Lentisphaeria bacterium]|nr:hypothetical protein [Lentisphaeria bacterium]